MEIGKLKSNLENTETIVIGEEEDNRDRQKIIIDGE